MSVDERSGGGPDLFYAGGESQARHGVLVRHTALELEDATRETPTRASIATAIDRDGFVKTWEVDGPRVEWLNEEDIDPTRNLFLASRFPITEFVASGGSALNRLDEEIVEFVEGSTDAAHFADALPMAFSASTFSASVTLRPRGRRWMRLRIEDSASSANRIEAWFDIEIGLAGSFGSFGNLAVVSTRAINEGEGFYRVIVEGTVSGVVSLDFTLFGATQDNELTYQGVGLPTFDFHKPQLEEGGDATLYQATPRDPDRASSSLLLEAEGENLATDSEVIGTGTGWDLLFATITPNDGAGGDGAQTADRLTDTVTTEFHSARQIYTVAADVNYAASIEMVKGSANFGFVIIDQDGLFANRLVAYFDLRNGVVTTFDNGTAVAVLGEVRRLPNGRFRCTLVGSIGNGATSIDVRWGVSLSGDSIDAGKFLGDGLNSVLLWGAQFEVADAPSSYIKTTTVAVTREADLFVTPYPHPPVEATYYQSVLVDGTQDDGGERFLSTFGTDAAFSTPRLDIRASGSVGEWQFRHHNGTTLVTATATLVAAAGELVELLAHVHEDGSTRITAIVARGDPVESTRTAANEFAARWFQEAATVGSPSVAFQTNLRHLALKAQRGIQTLDFMRAL